MITSISREHEQENYILVLGLDFLSCLHALRGHWGSYEPPQQCSTVNFIFYLLIHNSVDHQQGT